MNNSTTPGNSFTKVNGSTATDPVKPAADTKVEVKDPKNAGDTGKTASV